LSERYLGVDGAPILRRTMGVYAITWTYNGRGNHAIENYFGFDLPIARTDTGAARQLWV